PRGRAPKHGSPPPPPPPCAPPNPRHSAHPNHQHQRNDEPSHVRPSLATGRPDGRPAPRYSPNNRLSTGVLLTRTGGFPMNVRVPLLFCLAIFAALPAPAQDAH